LIANLASIPLVTAVQIAVTPSGNITQTNAQTALQQLDTLKLNTASFNALVDGSRPTTIGISHPFSETHKHGSGASYLHIRFGFSSGLCSARDHLAATTPAHLDAATPIRSG
jgi:hypothetical protein